MAMLHMHNLIPYVDMADIGHMGWLDSDSTVSLPLSVDRASMITNPPASAVGSTWVLWH